jgi:glycogen phosphorylase
LSKSSATAGKSKSPTSGSILAIPWELARPELALEVKLGGHTEGYRDNQGKYRVRWISAQVIKGIPYEIPVPGYKLDTCYTPRL